MKHKVLVSMVQKDRGHLLRRYLPVLVLFGLGVTISFFRDILIAHEFGASRDVELFQLGYALPNTVSQTFAIAFVGVAVPWLVRHSNAGTNGALEARSLVLRCSVYITCLLLAFGLGLPRLQIGLIAPGYKGELALRLEHTLTICWLMYAFIGLSFGLRAILNVRDVFWPGASTTAIRAALFVLLLLAASQVFPNWQPDADHLAWIAVAGGVAVLAMHAGCFGIAQVTRRRLSALISTSSWTQELSFMKSVGVAVSYYALISVPRFIDGAAASALSQGSVAATQYSYNVSVSVGILLGTAFNTVVMPQFSRALHAETGTVRTRPILIVSSSVVAFATVLGGAGFLMAENLTQLLYERGAFDVEATAQTATVLRFQLLGQGAMVAGLLLAHGLMALERLPGLIVAGAFKVVAKVLTLFVLMPSVNLDSIGLSYSVAEVVGAATMLVIFLVALQRHSRTRRPRPDPSVSDVGRGILGVECDARTNRGMAGNTEGAAHLHDLWGRE